MFERRRAVQTALKAADIIREYGWVQHELGNKARGFCAIGALEKVAQDDYRSESTVRDAFKVATGTTPVNFNDTAGRSAAEVIMAFEQVAHLIKTKKVPVANV